MFRSLLSMAFLVNYALSAFEVIPISGALSANTREYLWPSFTNGAITVNDHEIIIPDGSHLYIQSRTAPYNYTEIEFNNHNKDSFTIYETCENDNYYGFTLLAGDGRYYLAKYNKHTGEFIGPEPKHGLVDRMIILPNNNIIATGLFRPSYVEYLDRYDDNTQRFQTQLSKDKFMELYSTERAFSLAIYDDKLNLIDSGNVINRVGENAQVFERFYIKHPADYTVEGNIYLIDSNDGYVVERYNDLKHHEYSFTIENKNFMRIPYSLTQEDMNGIRKIGNSYSVPYVLYQKQGFIVTGFFQNPEYRGRVNGPYYYDVCTLQGVHTATGILDYPILCEDGGDKIFLFVIKDGGWFQDDLLFLVGITVTDLLTGQVSRELVDSSIESFEK